MLEQLCVEAYELQRSLTLLSPGEALVAPLAELKSEVQAKILS